MLKLTVRGIAAGLALVILGQPAGAHAASCPAVPVAQRFAPWSDPGWYAPVPGGGFEDGTAPWTLAGGAAAVAGNEPFHIGSPDDRRSLALPPDASATSPAICIGPEHPTLRLLARYGGPRTGSIAVSAVVRVADGSTRTLPIGVFTAGEWAPTAPLPVGLNAVALLAPQTVAFRFTARGGASAIDDVYVDPYGKG
jgi:hypothetical protein